MAFPQHNSLKKNNLLLIRRNAARIPIVILVLLEKASNLGSLCPQSSPTPRRGQLPYALDEAISSSTNKKEVRMKTASGRQFFSSIHFLLLLVLLLRYYSNNTSYSKSMIMTNKFWCFVAEC